MSRTASLSRCCAVLGTGFAYVSVAVWARWFFVEYMWDAFPTSWWVLLPPAMCALLWRLGSENISGGWFLKLGLYTILSYRACTQDWWGHLHEPGFEEICQHHPPLANATSGVRFLLVGLARSGTTAVSKAFHDLGLNAYHSEEFKFFAGRKWVTRVTQIMSPGTHARPTMRKVNAYSKEHGFAELAKALSSCQVDVLALDGMEKLLQPVWRMSPQAKVVLLDWRSYSDWATSLGSFSPQVDALQNVVVYIAMSTRGIIPWTFAWRHLDALLGSPLARRYYYGSPPVLWNQTVWSLWHAWEITANRGREFLLPPVGFDLFNQIRPKNVNEYNMFYNSWVKSVPEDKLLHFNPVTDSYETLCAFAGLASCPLTGKLAKVTNVWIFENFFPREQALLLSCVLCLHYVNFLLVKTILRCVGGVCCCHRRVSRVVRKCE
mmetsp:Transcript_13369/g.31344  ORF Transcript_13369/g.31344 Transcript_13369/m.31344 type:complete len:435 (-) Transcript_13369:62-1366(-)